MFLFQLFFNCSAVYTDVVWPSMYIASAQGSIPVIIAGLLIEIGFVKYFTKVGWMKTIVVTTVMNAVSATVGLILILILGLLLLLLLVLLLSEKQGHLIGFTGWYHTFSQYLRIQYLRSGNQIDDEAVSFENLSLVSYCKRNYHHNLCDLFVFISNTHPLEF